MLSQKEKVALEKWKKMRKIGKNKFVFRTGFLLYGMTLYLCYITSIIVINSIYHPEITLKDYITSNIFINRLLTTFILFGLMGWFMGNSILRSYKRRWDEFTDKMN